MAKRCSTTMEGASTKKLKKNDAPPKPAENKGEMTFPDQSLYIPGTTMPYNIKSSCGKKTYIISNKGCSCEDYFKRGHFKGPCKHIQEEAKKYAATLVTERSCYAEKRLVFALTYETDDTWPDLVEGLN